MKKKDQKNKASQASDSSNPATEPPGQITTKAELKSFLLNVRDRIADESAAPIYVTSALNHVLNLPAIYDLLDNENKEIARDLWLRLKQAGMQLRNPPMLFGPEEADLGASKL